MGTRCGATEGTNGEGTPPDPRMGPQRTNSTGPHEGPLGTESVGTPRCGTQKGALGGGQPCGATEDQDPTKKDPIKDPTKEGPHKGPHKGPQ